MRCAECRGACCEDFALPDCDLRIPPDARDWFELHVTRLPDEPGLAWFAVPCRALVDGRCSIYRSRPETCRDYAPGALGCLLTVKRRRTREQYEQIRNDADPPAALLYGEGGPVPASLLREVD